jgi:EAL domain-containing protein (putative c-di-GMP-specific phosphodiesterase class I)
MVQTAQCGEISKIITNRELSSVFLGIVHLEERILLGYEALILCPARCHTSQLIQPATYTH